MRPWPNRPVQQTVPLGSENFQLHIVEVALHQFVKECSGTRRRPSAAIKRTGADLGDESRFRAWHVDGGLDRSRSGAFFRAPIPITLQSATGGGLNRGLYDACPPASVARAHAYGRGQASCKHNGRLNWLFAGLLRGRSMCGRVHESDPFGATQRTRSVWVSLSSGRHWKHGLARSPRFSLCENKCAR
jgi:hypothetical protein